MLNDTYLVFKFFGILVVLTGNKPNDDLRLYDLFEGYSLNMVRVKGVVGKITKEVKYDKNAN